MQINADDPTDNPYAPIIRGFIQQTFPQQLTNHKDLLEALTQAFLASGNLRYGPIPSPEVLVGIRRAITDATLQRRPIPVLIPWGGRKAKLQAGLDIAEVMSLRQIQSLQERVKGFYEPGIAAWMRLEDVNAHLLYEGSAASRIAVVAYVEGMIKLINVLGMGDYLIPQPESQMLKEAEYLDLSHKLEGPITDYLLKTAGTSDMDLEWTPTFKVVKDLGWTGTVPKEQREYYFRLYNKLYPGEDLVEHTERMGRYFAGALARHQLKAVGGVPGSIQIAFTPPVPGAPDGLFSRRVYYRTLPQNMARTHIPGWRAKGYLKIEGNTVTPKLASFGDLPDGLEHCSIVLTDDKDLVRVRVETDYVVL